ncbi:hypothetical protein V6Z11_A10G275400 [Gossypium hirsutum]
MYGKQMRKQSQEGKKEEQNLTVARISEFDSCSYLRIHGMNTWRWMLFSKATHHSFILKMD